MSSEQQKQDERKSWDQYFMEMALLVGGRSTCLRRGVGAVIVKERRVLSTGYNGAPAGITHCAITGCLRDQMNVPSGVKHELCRGTHAEQNAVVQAARFGVQIKDSVIYTTTFPCAICTKLLINAGITKVVYLGEYHDDLSRELLAESGVEVQGYDPARLDSYFQKML